MKREPRLSGLRRTFSLPPSSKRLDQEVDEEIRFHIDSHVADLVARGVAPSVARERALQHYGDVMESRRELTRVDRARLTRMRWSSMFDAVRQDVGFALRTFRTKPAFAFASVLVLALGIGANATMFGVIDRLLFRPPAHVADPATVMTVLYTHGFRGEVDSQSVLSYPMYRDLVNTPGAFRDVAAYTGAALTLGRGAGARLVSANKVSANYFQTLGVRPRLGRFFAADEDGAPTAPNLVVVSYAYWQRELNGDPQAVGRTLPIGGAKYTIIGVAPAGFTGLSADPVDVWVPLTAGVSAADYEIWKAARTSFWLQCVVRLAPGVSRAAATEAATRVLRAQERASGKAEQRIAEQQPAIGFVSVLPREANAGTSSARVAALLGGVSILVLLIACANVANLQLARGIARRREIAIRIALGVSRGRLAMQLLTESVVLSVAGGIAAVAIIPPGSGFVRRMLIGTADLAGASVVDGRVLAYTAAASVAIGLLSGMMPALHAGRASLIDELKEGTRGAGSQRSRARTLLLLAQTMLSVLLLVGTGLFVRSLNRVDALRLGMEPDRVLVTRLQTTGSEYTKAEAAALYKRLLESAQSSPAIEAAALAATLPFYTSWAERVRVPGRDSLPYVRDGGPYVNEITPGYFATVGTRILRGRAFTASDTRNAPRVVIINESLAKLWWPGEDAIGKCMRIGADTMPCSEIVGIVENARRQTLIEDVSVQYFIPLEQSVRKTPPSYVLLARPRGEVASAAATLRRQLQSAAPNLPYIDIHPLEDLVSPQKRSWRLGASMFAVFGALALVLAAVGLYSVLAYDVAQRTREFGVRVAMGARTSDVMRLVLMSGLRTAVVGGLAGIVVALMAGNIVAPMLFQTSPRDPEVFATVLAIVTTIALLAACLPARRAVRVDPIVALRAE